MFAWRAVEKQMNLTLKSISPVKFHYDDGLLKITNRALFRHLTCQVTTSVNACCLGISLSSKRAVKLRENMQY